MRQCCAFCGSVFETGTISSNVCPHCSIHKYTVQQPDDLATWKSRAEEKDQLLGHANALIEEQAKHIVEVSSERDNLKSLCEKQAEILKDIQKFHLAHHSDCAYRRGLSCNCGCNDIRTRVVSAACGLDELLKQGEKIK